MKGFIKIIKNRLKGNSGYVTVEAVFAMSFFLIILLLSIAFFSYMYPQTLLQREVHILALTSERQGGLTYSDIDSFKASLQKYSFVNESTEEIIVTAETANGIDAVGVTPLDEIGDNYISRNSKEVINVTVKIPSNGNLLVSVAKFFGVTNVSPYYGYSEPVMSERY